MTWWRRLGRALASRGEDDIADLADLVSEPHEYIRMRDSVRAQVIGDLETVWALPSHNEEH